MQKTQSHSVTWYKCIVNEIEINTMLQKNKQKRKGKPPEKRLSAGDVKVPAEEEGKDGKDPHGGGPLKTRVARSRTETDDLWSKHMHRHEASVVAVSHKREYVQNLLSREQEILQSACEHMDRYIQAVSRNIARLRETRDIFLITTREARKELAMQRETLITRKNIYAQL